MPFLNGNEKVNCENLGIQTTRPNLVRHKKTCSAGSHIFSSGTNFPTNSRAETNYHIAKKNCKAAARFVR